MPGLPSPGPRRADVAVFFTLWLAYAYFHQGGGWNQNSRFAQVRAVVEDGRLAINRFCVYRADGGGELVRQPLPDRIPADFSMPTPNGLDISVYEGRVYPNKPPGTTLLAVPGYALVRGAGSLLGLPADGWLPLTAGFYLTTVLSTGLLGAAGGAVFLGISQRLYPEAAPTAHAAATLTYGLGTLIFPFATVMIDHAAAAFCGLAGFALILSAAAGGRGAGPRWAAAGLVLGLGVTVNYTLALTLPPLLIYAAARARGRRWLPAAWIALGGALPAALLGIYHLLAFGDPLAIANTYQHRMFMKGEGLLLRVFGAPDPQILLRLLLSPQRGLFFYSPALLLALPGLWAMARHRRQTAEALLLATIAVLFLLMNASFQDWHGGNSFGPRYLAPALPFLALPLTLACDRWRLPATALAAVSVAIHLLGTATYPMIGKDLERPLTEYVVPAFLGRPTPLDATDDPAPVSRNAAGVYEIYAYTVFPPGSQPPRWNAFNLGEALFPRRRLSLLPLVLILVLGTRATLKAADRT